MNPYIAYSIRLQQAFGLRRQEAIKFNVHYADKGDHIQLQGSWTKGGIPRIVPLSNPEQRTLLDEIKAFTAQGTSLIPPDQSYAKQLKAYENALASAGLKNLHGLRHAYAQRRYYELTTQLNQGQGWYAPYQGGKSIRDMTPEERKIDEAARLIISDNLGHSRKQISAIYLGS